jgi:hypothetical protein
MVTAMADEHELTYTTIVEGKPLSAEMIIIGALVRRLGGTVVLSVEEMGRVQGVVLRHTTEGLQVDAGNDA